MEHLGVAVEGETFLLAGTFLAHRGIFHLPLVILVAVATNCGADQIYYLTARTRGRNWLQGRFGQHRRYQHIVDLTGRYSNCGCYTIYVLGQGTIKRA